MTSILDEARRTIHARFGTISERRLHRAFNQVRGELAEVGLLADGRYLDGIDCVQSALPSFAKEMGYVFDEGVPWFRELLGYQPGVIYIPLNPPVRAYVPGGTLVDTIRHEFAHAWYWLDGPFLRRPWFRDTFGARYTDAWSVGDASTFDPAEFVSSYACTAPAEDFAETFMAYLRHRRSLDRLAHRPGVRRKLRAVAAAIASAARDRAPRIRGPR